jgi:shikimate kinase
VSFRPEGEIVYVHIILIGYRGTGKSRVGKRLAAKLQMPFYDTDELIKAAAGRSIQEMVAENGWAYFREREREIVRELAVMHRSVIATGGGAVMDEENADIFKKHGVLIWLNADVKTIVERIQADIGSRERRPSFSDDDIFQETEDVLRKRIPVYSGLADFSIDTVGKNINEIVNNICQFLSRTGRVSSKESSCQEVP